MALSFIVASMKIFESTPVYTTVLKETVSQILEFYVGAYRVTPCGQAGGETAVRTALIYYCIVSPSA
jgi:hypothetical protein